MYHRGSNLLHSTHALRCTARFTLALASHLLQFHLTETEGQTDGDAAAVVLVIGVGLHIRAVVVLSEAVPIEDVVRVDIHRQLTVEEVGAKASIDAVTGMAFAEQRLRRRALVARSRHFQFVPQLGPHIQAETVRPLVKLVGFSVVFGINVGIV